MLEPGFKKLGLDLRDIKYVISTHAHRDHFGGIPYFRAHYPGFKVVMPDADWAAPETAALRDLALRDVDTFVGLGMRAQRDAPARRQRRHRRDIAVERLDIEDERGRVEVGARSLSADQMSV